MQSLFRSTVGAVRRGMRLRSGDGYPGGWWSPGTHEPTGHLFGEAPRAPGVARKWEDWEAPYYISMVVAGLMLTVGLSSKPDTSIIHWAHQEALRRMEEEAAE